MILHLPFKIGDQIEATDTQSQNVGEVMPSGKRLKILFCEDSRMLRTTFKKLLQREGFDVTVCEHGEDLVTVFPTEDWQIVITDKQMPKMNGEIAAQILKETHKDRNFRIILLTADANCPQSPFVDRVLVKPTSSQHLKFAILEEYFLVVQSEDLQQKYAVLT